MKITSVAEIGINHNASVSIAIDLIDLAIETGCDYVKFQKRTPEICVPKHMWNQRKKTPLGEMYYIDYKRWIEFETNEYDEIYAYCEGKIKCFASVWDIEAASFMKQYTDVVKVPSALITDIELLNYCHKNFKTVVISTGMSTQKEVDEAIVYSRPDVVMHSVSAYPCRNEDLNLNYISYLLDNRIYKNYEVGYSGHENGIAPTIAAIALGATWIERHITLDKTMWGSDHSASLNPEELKLLMSSVREIEHSLGGYNSRNVLDCELSKRNSLRGN